MPVDPDPNKPVNINDVAAKPDVQATIPFIADKIPANVRAWLYPVLGVASVVAWRYNVPQVAEEITFWSSIVGLGVATANVPRTTGR